ncbi:threonine dehydratase [Cellulomonas denverensis]|uniref:Threonine dehydratase n=1 Tax=Cellulomonas denverensis TaxID=264297 RepID=A0A7X6KY05_9CELL|nr:threonine dehydratase [Cellulomonas denverensis]NKY24285.1 threonine dehydratase [Cellulomonas denverensis]GIG26764.1 serine/threonine dehydratase [Cellulomonas denverensis]
MEPRELHLTADTLDHARDVVARHVPRSAAYRWPLIEAATGTTTWIKHENHNPTGAFKVRGGLTFMAHHADERPGAGVISASRGNHSQSLAFAGAAAGVPVTIVVPEGNSPDKNAATEAFGAELIVHGRDFQAAVDHSRVLADQRGLVPVPPVHPWLVEGVATYAAELHEDVPGLDVVYVPVGMGSGICANIAVRDLIGSGAEVVGVVADRAPAYALSFDRGEPVATDAADTLIDGVACRIPDPGAVAVVVAGASRIERAADQEALDAMALLYRATHNLAEPAGAIALAAAVRDRELNRGRRVAVVLTGGNCDHQVLARAFGG